MVLLLQPASRRRAAGASRPPPSPADFEHLGRIVLDRVTRAVGTPPQDFNLMRNLGVLVVSAAPAYLKALLEQPEIASAAANLQGERK